MCDSACHRGLIINHHLQNNFDINSLAYFQTILLFLAENLLSKLTTVINNDYLSYNSATWNQTTLQPFSKRCLKLDAQEIGRMQTEHSCHEGY